MLFEEKRISKLREILSDYSKFAVVVHSHPDGDALGSGIAMTHYLSGKGKSAILIIPDSVPETLAFLTEGEAFVDAAKFPAKATACLKECDVLFALDMNGFHRADKLEQVLTDCTARHKVLIDHHLNPELSSFDLVFSEIQISSACELLFWLLMELEGSAEALPEKTRYGLMTGMTTDTNNFANSVYPSTFEMATMLLAAGVDRDDIIANLYQEYRENRVRALAALLKDNLKILPCGAAYMVATNAFLQAYELNQGETEGLVNIPLEIKEVKISLFLKQEKDHFRVSIRSKRGWSANVLAKKYFNGGGHELAAGGKLYYPQDIPLPEDVYNYIQTSVAQFLQKDTQR
ncbi:MAG: hypothetical protein GX899_03840 [Rikenellaceae bacterium]|nr:hypothetical protein [Rikenellaceae bacterium]